MYPLTTAQRVHYGMSVAEAAHITRAHIEDLIRIKSAREQAARPSSTKKPLWAVPFAAIGAFFKKIKNF